MGQTPDEKLHRFEPDLDEFSELQRAFWRRAVLHGVPAVLAGALCLALLPAVLFAGAPWWLLLIALPAGAGALMQLGVLWADRPAFSVTPTSVEIGAGMLRFVDERTGTVEEVRWKREAAVSVRRANDAVEITLPSGRRNRVHWFAYENRERLLKELLALEQSAVAQPSAPKAAPDKPVEKPPDPPKTEKPVAEKPAATKGEGKARKGDKV